MRFTKGAFFEVKKFVSPEMTAGLFRACSARRDQKNLQNFRIPPGGF